MFKKISVQNVFQNLLESQVKFLLKYLPSEDGRKNIIKPIVVIFVNTFGTERI